MRFRLVILLLFSALTLFGQREHIALSDKHVQKIEKTKSAKEKLKRYKKYYSKDSIKVVKKIEALDKRLYDSITTAANIVENRVHLPDELKGKLGQLDAKNKIKLPHKDYKQLVNQYGPEQAKEIKNKFNQYGGDLKKYKSKYGDFNAETFKEEKISEGKKLLESRAQSKGASLVNQNEIAGYQKQVDAWKKEQFKYNEQLKQMGDSAYLKREAKEKAEQAAMDFMEKNPAILKATQAKANALMKVYSYVPNSNDLSTAVKRTSLKGRTFKERLVLGGNFQVVTIKPFMVDFFPMIGYKIKSNWSAGVGGSARLTATSNTSSLLGKSFGYKAFSSYDLIRNFFAFTEFNRNTAGRASVEEGGDLKWNNSWLLGVGKKISVYHKVDMTILALYNFFYKPDDPLYPRPFTLRVGFQLSDTALLNRKAN